MLMEATDASNVKRYPALATLDSLMTSLYLHEFCTTSKCPPCIDFVFFWEVACMRHIEVRVPPRPLRIACIGMGLNSVASIPEASGLSNCFALNPLYVMASPSSLCGHPLVIGSSRIRVLLPFQGGRPRDESGLCQSNVPPSADSSSFAQIHDRMGAWGANLTFCASPFGMLRHPNAIERLPEVYARDRFINDRILPGSSEAETDGRSKRRDFRTKSEICELEMTNLQSLNGGSEEKDSS
ncbi:hypothetical protein VNO77_03580 [Canavalia gladiata]|uniref:Uncharacterized protein n=1 Tax=Canavalia gladiata TaxID=3824 RepID=A0AAN9MVK7_CANGL